MTTGIASIALFAPVVASNAVFSARRFTRGVDTIESNPLLGLTNMDIAAGQVLKGGRAVKAISQTMEPQAKIVTEGSAKVIKDMSSMEKAMNAAGKVIKFTADNINPIIVGAGVIKVAASDDKVDEAGRESLRLGTMFAFEGGTRKLIGMPIITKKDNKMVSTSRTALVTELFSTEQKKAMEDFIKTKKSAKFIIGGGKGLLFAGASIGGYKLGDWLSNKILGEKNQVKETA